jgi:PIN domain nuclease of toxin-antitoxin system
VSVAYIDTHIAVYLHDGLTEELSNEAERQMEANDLLLSPMAYLELDYLFRRKKIGVGAEAIFATLNTSFGVALCQFPFAQVAHEALSIAWTTDPFDRLIVAQAGANHGAMLITRDRLIRRNYSNPVW